MLHRKQLKCIASIVLFSYGWLINVSGVEALQFQMQTIAPLLAQAASNRGLQIGTEPSEQKPASKPSQTPLSLEDRKAQEAILNGKIHHLEESMNGKKGLRKSLLNIAVGAFAIGATLTFGVNRINAAIDDIAPNPEENPGDATLEERQAACSKYVCSDSEKRDALKSLEGIKGIGGGIFVVGALSLVSYFWQTHAIRQNQREIEALRTAADSLFETRGLTPAYLQQNESVAAVVEEMEFLKKKAGASHTWEELFLRLALGGLGSGLFLVGLSNVSHTIVENITIDETNLNDVTAKNNALDKTDELETVGIVLLGAGTAAGITSVVFGRLAKRHERQIDELEDSLWRVADRIEFQPKVNGFAVMYRYAF